LPTIKTKSESRSCRGRSGPNSSRVGILQTTYQASIVPAHADDCTASWLNCTNSDEVLSCQHKTVFGLEAVNSPKLCSYVCSYAVSCECSLGVRQGHSRLVFAVSVCCFPTATSGAGGSHSQARSYPRLQTNPSVHNGHSTIVSLHPILFAPDHGPMPLFVAGAIATGTRLTPLRLRSA